ncbi:hypothetical protein fh0823_24500 [Francisella halioticida]|uniref:hypothetical protein n=1 Tax=Francisella halioticida TaxID=549298 RepID=UPI001AF7AAB5|nr:hypothetical protein [Francisella halioticida]BCD92311.1 hypothetical protein fh0823_24500 [Francisella halioticida]
MDLEINCSQCNKKIKLTKDHKYCNNCNYCYEVHYKRIGYFFRKIIAYNAYIHYVPKLKSPYFFQDISKNNLRTVRAALSRRAFSYNEKFYLQQATNKNFLLKHFTAANTNEFNAIFSRKKLIKDGITFNEENTALDDIENVGDDHFVFFSFHYDNLTKTRSRFGENVISLEMNSHSLDKLNICATLDDYATTSCDEINIIPPYKETNRLLFNKIFPHLNDKEIEVLQVAFFDYINSNDFKILAKNFQFNLLYGADIPTGIALFSILLYRNIINNILAKSYLLGRKLSEYIDDAYLKSNQNEYLDALMSHFKIIVKIPIFIFFKNWIT